MLRKLRILTWEEFDHAVFKIADYYSGVALSGVFGVHRGGLPLAVALSHKLKIPMLKEPQANALWVDEIVETGKTLREYLNYDMYQASWFGPKEIRSLFSVEELDTSLWLVFPWEDKLNAERDMKEYELSRQ